MKRLALFTLHLSLFTLLCGCSTVTINTRTYDGKGGLTGECHAERASMFQGLDKGSFSACGSQARVAGSAADLDLLLALLKAAAR